MLPQLLALFSTLGWLLPHLVPSYCLPKPLALYNPFHCLTQPLAPYRGIWLHTIVSERSVLCLLVLYRASYLPSSWCRLIRIAVRPVHFSQIPGRAAEPKRLVRHGFDNIIPNKVFHIMIEVILIFQTSYNLTWEGLIVPKIEDPLKPGNHYFVSDGQFSPTSSSSSGCEVIVRTCPTI